MSISPEKLLEAICPAGATVTRHESSPIIGTAYGKWLGKQYMRELRKWGQPRTYGLVDWDVYTGSTSWQAGKISTLIDIDPLVAGALAASEFTRGFLGRLRRTDILNSDTDEVFEIKPIGSRDDGPQQLEDYLVMLQALAPWRPIHFSQPGNEMRDWRPGTWDPTPYPFVIPGFGGRICVLHAWNDPGVNGLIVYDIKCCSLPADARPELRPAKVATVVREIEPELRPGLEQMVLEAMPLGEAGARYAILTSERFFELFVMGAWQRKWERLELAKPGPIFKKLILESQVLLNVMSGGFGGPVAIYLAGLPPEQAKSMLELERMLTTSRVVSGIGAMVAVGAVWFSVKTLGAAVPLVRALSSSVLDALSRGIQVAPNLAPRATPLAQRAAPSLLNGSSRLLQIGRTAAVRGLGSGMGSALGSDGASAGLGVLGAIVYVALPAEAAAAPSGSPETQAAVVGSELPLLVPVELLEPIGSNIIEAGSFVRCGYEKFFVPAIVSADDH